MLYKIENKDREITPHFGADIFLGKCIKRHMKASATTITLETKDATPSGVPKSPCTANAIGKPKISRVRKEIRINSGRYDVCLETFNGG